MSDAPGSFSDYIVYVDESGDHSLAKFDPEFPVFVLTFCIFRKEEYINQIVPALQRIKFKHFGHDMVVFHERDIRKASGPFAFLTDAPRRHDFMADLNGWVEQSPFLIIAVVIRKAEFAKQHVDGRNAYHFAMRLGLERVEKYLRQSEPQLRPTHIVFEARGRREDEELELEFRRVCGGENYLKASLPFQVVFAGKQINSSGLQLADLTARPVGRHVMNPAQANRAYAIIEKKMDRSEHGAIDGFGLTTYP
ncbi:MAG: DUF3800 domain-containing protein [Pirellulales bacterium]